MDIFSAIKASALVQTEVAEPETFEVVQNFEDLDYRKTNGVGKQGQR